MRIALLAFGFVLVCLAGAPALAAERTPMTAGECEILQFSDLEEPAVMGTGEVLVSRREVPREAPPQLQPIAPRRAAVPRLCLGEEVIAASCASGPVDTAPDTGGHSRAHDPACLSSAPPLPPLARGTLALSSLDRLPPSRPGSRIERPPRG